ncbi:MAG: UDP-glucose 4-epimerase GalE [Candidatus Kerfeldbacteria bacterium]|nr:UDP-glucose 4-epimerase GalE [Candidatus Kerfeldbacteria bacterium]
MNILVTGGAGYIGSHICRALLASGYAVHALDNLSSGHAEVAVGTLHTVDLGDVVGLRNIFAEYHIDAVVHCAGLINVADSMQHPEVYRTVNIEYTKSLLEEMARANVRDFVFSSSCAVYGTPQHLPVDEATPFHPESVYAETKVAAEEIIRNSAEMYGMRYAILRYFNACGAAANGSAGEWHDPETHLIPNVIRAAMSQQPVMIFGNDYPTSDGTCVRDYVHVEDLADAHVKALQYIDSHVEPLILNLGSGHGYSNAEIVAAVETELKTKIVVQYGPRRVGDPACIEASNEKARMLLGWQPRHDLASIIRTAVEWEIKNKIASLRSQ